MNLDARIPDGPIEEKWRIWKDNHELVGPRRRSDHVIAVVGTGLAGASAASTLAGMGYRVEAFCYQDSARRAHSIAAQGGINATKDYSNDGDSLHRLFADTIKGGDFRSREANVWRLAELSTEIIDQAVAQGVPFNREYGGLLATRSFGGVLVERTFYCRGQTGQQLLLGAYGALSRQIKAGRVTMHTRHEMLDIVICDGRARGIVARDLVTGETRSYPADAVVLATGGYSNVYFLSTNAMGCNVTAIWRAYRRGAAFANPCFTQIHPTCIPATAEHQSKLTLMSESLRNDGRVWVPRDPNEQREPNAIPDAERYYFLEEMYPRYGNLVPRDVASRAAKHVCDQGLGVGPTGRAVYMDFRDAIEQRGEHEMASRYGNLFELYEQITGETPWQTTIPGLFAIGEANFSDHGANRLGASAMMQCLADGYFVLPHTVTDYLARLEQPHADPTHPAYAEVEAEVDERLRRLLAIDGKTPTSHFHRELGKLMLDSCGVARLGTKLAHAVNDIPKIGQRFWSELKVGGDARSLNQSLEYAGRVADFIELGQLMCRDALMRDESCGCHLREEHQGADGEPIRNDERFAHVAVWEHKGSGVTPMRHVEELEFSEIKPKARSYR